MADANSAVVPVSPFEALTLHGVDFLVKSSHIDAYHIRGDRRPIHGGLPIAYLAHAEERG